MGDSTPPFVRKLDNASNVVLIDNYDSFTWNVYQYLALEGATVTVFRNDQVTIKQLIELHPTQLVISPGPGHPSKDAGVSCDAIRYFAGRIPILGVCMGQQCMITVFGGKVEYAGEILHGKTSPLRHDKRGIYRGLAQDFPVTRYHSLAGTHATLPDSLELSSWTLGDEGEDGVIMGVRHKEFTIEGVQFHPESILTTEGQLMLRNFLRLSGGKWTNADLMEAPEPERGSSDVSPRKRLRQKSPQRKMSAANYTKRKVGLDEIFAARREAVEEQKRRPSQSPEDLDFALELGLAPPLVSFQRRIHQTSFDVALMAEIKRASPSKGTISANACAPAIAIRYAMAGASVISVLTEPRWFRGDIDDLRAVSKALANLPNRPAILRKEFVFSEYQIIEARLAGADSVLLIVKMLSTKDLKRLVAFSRGIGMEPLVEVNTSEELQAALAVKAEVIGINNRNLVTFEVDLDTTTRLLDQIPSNVTVCALSGIAGPADIEPYLNTKVDGVLVGEAMMLAPDPSAFVMNLMGVSNRTSPDPVRRLIKICGTRTPSAAKVAVQAGADMVGIILAKGRRRTISEATANEVSRVVHTTQRYLSLPPNLPIPKIDPTTNNFFEITARWHLWRPDRALLVGVFQDQSLEFILEQQQKLCLDVVQLHGDEPADWATAIPCPVIKSFKPGEFEMHQRGLHALPLMDSGRGGTGSLVNLDIVRRELRINPALRIGLAGGLTAPNVATVLKSLKPYDEQVVAVDVSSGLERNGVQDHELIIAFIQAVREMERVGV